MLSPMKRSVASSFMLRSRLDSKKRNATHAALRPSEQQALFLLPVEGSDRSLARSALVCHQGYKQREAKSLLVLKWRAGPTCGILLGHDFERSDALYLQPWLPAAWGSQLCCLLTCSADRLCLCRERTEMSVVHGWSRRHIHQV
jgi:hypothetical protein